MQKKLIVSSSPFLRSKATTRSLMLDVVIALLPTALAAVWFFGADALMLQLVAVCSAVLAEGLYQRISHQRVTLSDGSAVVTGLLLAFNLPANAPWWLAMVGSVLAIVLVKQLFGGLGQNFINPALAARTILMLSWTGLMAASAQPDAGAIFGLHFAPDTTSMATQVVDVISTATPLADGAKTYTLWQLFSGNIPGMLGETCKLTLLLGGLYLIIRRVVDWRVPLCFISTVFLLFWLKTGVLYSPQSGADNALYQVLSGSLLLGAFFMATDYVTCPVTRWGRVIMGVGCGVILFVIRAFNPSYPEGCSFAILFMNLLVPLIDKWTMSTSFGGKEKPTKEVQA